MPTTIRPRQRIRLAAALLTALVVVALCGPAGAVQSRWLVPDDAVLPTGSVVVGALPLAGALVVEAPHAPSGGVAYDSPVAMQSLPPAADELTGLRIDSGVASTRAPEVWDGGELGERAVVALVDTGVAPVAALQDAVVGEIDFSGSGSGGDGYGHGTFLASLIAANAAVAPGAAPHAGILSLKVARADGSTSLGAVLSALQWLHSVGRFGGVRIATLALGVDADTDAARMLDQASDTLARSGVLVVTAAGNDGPGALTSPATATRTFSVGAVDDAGTADPADDTAAPYSATGLDRDGVAQPDQSTSGTNIVSWMASDAAIATGNPAGRIDEDLFRGSGTSMAAALTAGVAALASSARPDLSGDELAGVLQASGATLDATAVLAAAEAAPAGTGPAAKTRWLSPEDAPGPKGKFKGHDGNADPNGVRWGGVRWGNAEPNGVRWGGVRWGGVRWGGVRWGGVRWGGVRWGGVRWGGSHWADAGWEPGTWGGSRWSGHGWVGEDVHPQGVRWGGAEWNGVRWGGVRWGADGWAGVRWSMLEAPPT